MRSLAFPAARIAAIFVGAAVTVRTSPARAAGRPVFDLYANRSLAHLERSGALVIAAGSPGFARYLHFSRPRATWRLDLVEEGRRVALAHPRAVLAVPLTAAQARAATVVLRLKSVATQRLGAEARGRRSPEVSLQPGWQTVTLQLPSGALSEGENQISLSFTRSGTIAGQKGSAVVEWIQLGGAPPPSEAPAPRAAVNGALEIARGDALAYYVQIPQGGALALSGQAGGCTLRLRTQASKASKAHQATIELDRPLDLARLAGQVLRLSIAAEGEGCTRVRLRSAALTSTIPAPALRPPAPPRNLIFWMTDSTRADRYRAFNPKTRVETPVMDDLARRATLFRVAYVQGNESRVSHASYWTGMYPAQHRFIAPKATLDKKLVTLAEAIRPSGLYTAGYMANGYVSARWGFAEGFDLLKNHIHEGGGLKAEDLVRTAKGFLSRNAARPFFLYLGTIDAHVSWRAHEPWISRYDPAPYSGPFLKGCMDPQLDRIVQGSLKLSDRDRSRIVALYDCDVSYNDHHFGALLEALKTAGHAEDTMVILSADHGEEMFDHGRLGHGQSLREELVHVPLMIYYPPLFPGGRVVEEGVESIDLLPTLVDALGGKIPAEVQGESLIPLAQGEGAGYPRPAIASQYELAHTMRLGRWKLWVGGSGQVRLHDAEGDPGEAHELSTERPVERRFVTDALSLWKQYQGRWKKSRWGVASNHRPAFADDLEKQ